MTQDNVNPKVKDKSSSKKKKTKVFGLMTKRRWFAVAIFLCGITWSYTVGPPLNTVHVANEYYQDPISYDYSTVAVYEETPLIDNLFKPKFLKDLWIAQVGAHYGTIESPIWFDEKLLFSDVEKNTILHYTPTTGTQLFLSNFNNQTVNNNLMYPGPSGLLRHPKHPHLLYICHQGLRTIFLYDSKKNKFKVVASHYEGNKFNSPKDLVLSPDNKHIYFTDSSLGLIQKNKKLLTSEIGFNGIYRISIDEDNKKVDLLSKSLLDPTYLLLSNDKKLLFVANCVQNEFEINIFLINNNEINLKETWNANKIYQNVHNKNLLQFKGQKTCIDGMTLHPKGHILFGCYQNKVCILNEKNGKLEAIIKLADGVHMTDLGIVNAVYENITQPMLYITSNYSLWEMQLRPFTP